jgi:hypothetical protein
MPLVGDPLAEEIRTIRDWLAGGAPDGRVVASQSRARRGAPLARTTSARDTDHCQHQHVLNR